MKRTARFAAALATLITFTGLLLSLGFKTAAESHAIGVSAVLAALVQMTAYSLVETMGRANALIGWGMGAILRGTILVLYGFFFARMLGLPLAAALVSFAVFLFVSMLLESLLRAYES